ncbi:putative nuclease HARBI1 [Heptranchias perlo]|uniref:putative nuclease HARBI1 n=1 Tax=Heptranchias perlo TaxID=212740 RepID=UPI003559AE68
MPYGMGPAGEQRGDQRRGRGRRRHYPRERVYRQRLTFLDLSEDQCLRRLRLSRLVVADICMLLQAELLPDGPGGHALPVTVEAISTLNSFASGSFQGATGDITRISQSSAHKCIRQVTDGLFTRTSDYVNFPIYDISQTERPVSFHSLTGFPWMQGTIDCTHVAIRGPAHEPGLFINRKGYHSIKAQLVCDHWKTFLQVCARFPGSCHDSFILCESNIPALFQAQSRLKGWLLGDKGYPLQTWLITPVRNPTYEAQQHITTRSVIEHAIGMLKMRFRCLDRSGGSLQYSAARVCRIIVVHCILHNIAQQRGLPLDEFPCAHKTSAPTINIEEGDEEKEEEDDGQPIDSAAAHLAPCDTRELLIFDRFS